MYTCKALEWQIKKLEKQNRQLLKQQEAYQNIITLKLFTEVIEEQLGGALTETVPSMDLCRKQSLKQLINAMVLIKISLEDHTERDSMLSDSGVVAQDADILQVDQQPRPPQYNIAAASQSEISQLSETGKYRVTRSKKTITG